MNLCPKMADISVDNQRASFNTGPYVDLTPHPPLKLNILKKGVFACLSWPKFKLGHEPKFHEAGTFGG